MPFLVRFDLCGDILEFPQNFPLQEKKVLISHWAAVLKHNIPFTFLKITHKTFIHAFFWTAQEARKHWTEIFASTHLLDGISTLDKIHIIQLYVDKSQAWTNKELCNTSAPVISSYLCICFDKFEVLVNFADNLFLLES